MKLAVVRYRNYGCTFSGDDEGEEHQNKFYWSFFELNNGGAERREVETF